MMGMSEKSRHGRNTKIAGASVGGQFAASVRTAADGSALDTVPAPKTLKEVLVQQRLQQIADRQAEMATIAYAMHNQHLSLFENEAALTIRAQHPEAQKLVLGLHHGSDSTHWALAGIEGPNGTLIELDAEFEEDLENLIADAGIDAQDRDYDTQNLSQERHAGSPFVGKWSETAKIDLDIAGADDHVNVSRSFIDTGNLDETGFGRVHIAAITQLGANTTIRTHGDFQDLLRDAIGLDGEFSEDEIFAIAKRAAAEHRIDETLDDFEYRRFTLNAENAADDARKARAAGDSIIASPMEARESSTSYTCADLGHEDCDGSHPDHMSSRKRY